MCRASREFLRGSAGSVAETGVLVGSFAGGSGTLRKLLSENHVCVVSKSL